MIATSRVRAGWGRRGTEAVTGTTFGSGGVTRHTIKTTRGSSSAIASRKLTAIKMGTAACTGTPK